MKKIMFVIPYLSDGGAERVTAVLANEISQMDGYEVHMLTYKRLPEQEYPVTDAVCWHSMDMDYSGIRALWEKVVFLRTEMKQIRPDCVISLGGAGVISLLALSRIGLNIPLVLSERNDPKNDPKKWYLRILRQLAYDLCDGIVFQTHGAMAYFARRIQKKGQVIRNPLTSNLPARFQGTREKRIVTSCRLNVQKNLELMIDAFSDIAYQFESYVLHIYGEGEERNRLEEKIHAMGMESRIVLKGYSNHIHQDIWKAAMFVSSSDYEGISNSMLEAIAMGIPTVCTDCPPGGARETICHGINGLLVPVGNREALACAMTEILQNPGLSETLSSEGEKLRSEISADVIALQWISFVRQVIEQYGH